MKVSADVLYAERIWMSWSSLFKGWTDGKLNSGYFREAFIEELDFMSTIFQEKKNDVNSRQSASSSWTDVPPSPMRKLQLQSMATSKTAVSIPVLSIVEDEQTPKAVLEDDDDRLYCICKCVQLSFDFSLIKISSKMCCDLVQGSLHSWYFIQFIVVATILTRRVDDRVP